MKKLLTTLPILLISIGAMAQNKPVEQQKPQAMAKDTAVYAKFVKVPENFYNSLTLFAQLYKESVIYNPNMSAEVKNQEQINTNQFLNSLSKVADLDSVRVNGVKGVKKP